MEEKEKVCCWLDKENSVVSFHQEDGFEKKRFSSQKDMMDFCCVLISMGYRVQ